MPDLRLVLVDAEHVVAGLREAGAGHQSRRIRFRRRRVSYERAPRATPRSRHPRGKHLKVLYGPHACQAIDSQQFAAKRPSRGPTRRASPAFRDTIQRTCMRILLDYRPALRHRTGVGEWVHELGLQPPGPSAGRRSARPRPRSDRLDARPARPACAHRRCASSNGATFDRPHGSRPSADLGLEPPGLAPGRGADGADASTSSTRRRRCWCPARSGLRVCTIYDLDFLSHPERTRARDAARLPDPGSRARARGPIWWSPSPSTRTAQIEARLCGRCRTALPSAGPACRPGSPGRCPAAPATRGHLLFRRHARAAQERRRPARGLPARLWSAGRRRRRSCSPASPPRRPTPGWPRRRRRRWRDA